MDDKKIVEIYGVQKEEGGYVYLNLHRDAMDDLDFIARHLGTDRDKALQRVIGYFTPEIDRQIKTAEDAKRKEERSIKGRVKRLLGGDRKDDPSPTLPHIEEMIRAVAAQLRARGSKRSSE